MSLIEQLGGYSMAYAYYESLSNGSTACMHSNVIYSKESLGLLLLDYRRAHGIYEVGDKFVMLKIWHDDLMTVEDGDMDEPCWNTRIIRHATDAEIEAGCRL